MCFGRDARRHRFFFLSFSFLFCPLPTADCIFSVMINKFAGSHGGGGGKSDTGKSAELFFVCVRAYLFREKEKVVVVRRRRLMEKMRTRAILRGCGGHGKVAFRVRIPTDRIIRDSFRDEKREKEREKVQHSISA